MVNDPSVGEKRRAALTTPVPTHGYVLGPDEGVPGRDAEVKCSLASTGGSLALYRSVVDGQGPLPHRHTHEDETIFVFDGTLQADFHFLGKTGDQCLDRAALYPMLAAFRWMIVEKSDGKFAWRDGFEHALDVWRRAAGEMMKATQATHAEYRYKLTNLGKSRTHWGTMFNVVARHDLELRAPKR